MTWAIREGRVDEIERLVELRMGMFEAMSLLDEKNRVRTRAACLAYFRETISSEAFRVWVAVSKAAVPIASVGLVVHSVPPSPANSIGKVGYIMNLVTLPEWRRKGIARALLTHVLDVLREKGVPVASLHASVDGRALYEELGFEVRDTLPEMVLRL